MKLTAGVVTALLFAMVWGFFVAFNVVFSDIFGVRQMAEAVAFVLFAYTALGLGFGLAGPRTGWRWMWWLGTPGALFVALGLFDNVARTFYHAAVIGAVMGGAGAGAWIGASMGTRIRERFSRGRASS